MIFLKAGEKMVVRKEKLDELYEKMAKLQIREEDLLEKFILGSGSGGQKINKTSSCVYLKHLPSGIEIKCQKDRSRELNRFLARRELCKRLEERENPSLSKEALIREKIRKQKNRRNRRREKKE